MPELWSLLLVPAASSVVITDVYTLSKNFWVRICISLSAARGLLAQQPLPAHLLLEEAVIQCYLSGQFKKSWQTWKVEVEHWRWNFQVNLELFIYLGAIETPLQRPPCCSNGSDNIWLIPNIAASIFCFLSQATLEFLIAGKPSSSPNEAHDYIPQGPWHLLKSPKWHFPHMGSL